MAAVMAADAAHGRHRRVFEEWERTASVLEALFGDRVLRAVWSLLGLAAVACLAGMLTACSSDTSGDYETGDFPTSKPARQLCLENSWRFQYSPRECDGDGFKTAALGDCMTPACADIILRRPPSYDPNQTRS